MILDLIFGMIQYMHETPLKSLDNPVGLTFYVFFLPSIFDTSTRYTTEIGESKQPGHLFVSTHITVKRMKSWYLTLLNNSKRRLKRVVFRSPSPVPHEVTRTQSATRVRSSTMENSDYLEPQGQPFINGCLVISNHFLYKDLESSN